MPSPSKSVEVCSNFVNKERFRDDDDDQDHASEETRDEEEKVELVLLDKSNLEIKVDDETASERKGEAEDGLAILKGWPTFSEFLTRRGSCEFTTCVSPCVKKATSHLQQLQEHLARCNTRLEQSPEGFKGPASSYGNSTSGRLDSSSTPYCMPRTSPLEGAVELTPVSSSPSSDDMSFLSDIRETSLIKSSLAQVYRSKMVPPLVKSANSSKPRSAVFSMSSAVVDEVIRLLGRLDHDRLTTQQMLIQEKQKVKMLGSQIDRLAFKRMMALPAAVQKEHESCATDINELKWHCSYQGRLQARCKRRVDYAETQYLKFNQDVESSKRSCPLVKEKLDLEGLAMESIQAKQDETEEELRQTLRRLDATERKTNEGKLRATQERTLIKQDVDVIRNLLNEVSDELAQLKMNFTSNVHTISDIKNTLKGNAEQCHNLEKREERIKSQETAQQDKAVKLREKIAEQGSEHVRLSEENEKLRKDNQVTEGDYQNTIARLKVEIKQYETQVRELTRRNKAMREDMDSTAKQVEKCKKQKNSDKKSLVRAAQEIEKIKQQNEMMSDEAKKLKTLNHSLKTTKVNHEEEYFTEEDSLRNAESSLRGQLKEEAHIRTVLQARIAADTSDLLRSRVDSKKKKEKVSQQAADAEKIVNRVKEQVLKMEKVHEERQQTIAQINDVLDKLAKQRDEMERKYGAKIEELRPNEERAKKERLELEQNIDHIVWKSNMMSNKMDDMSSSTVMMSRVIQCTQEDIEELEEDNKEAKLRLESSIDTEESLRQALDETKERLFLRREEHEMHLEGRNFVLAQTTNLLGEKLAENKVLAEHYQKFNSKFLQIKDQFFKTYEIVVNEESHLKDHKELHTLQERMRECLQHYYNLRGLQNQSRVAQFLLHSQKNSWKLCKLQEELTNIVTHINNFLESNNNSHQTISMETAAIRC